MHIAQRSHPVSAFFLFHLSVGTRLALRKFAPILATIFAIYFLFEPVFFISLMAAFIQAGPVAIGLFSVVISLGIAGIAAPRICHGLLGWIRHLPVGKHAHRRLAGIAIFVAQLPILFILAGIAIITSFRFGISVTTYLVGLPLLGWASAQFVLPVERKIITKSLALVACLSSTAGYWPLLFVGIILLVIADTVSGPLFRSQKRRHFHRTLGGFLFPLSLSWRALALRISPPFPLSLFVIGAAVLLVSNNDPSPSLSLKVVRLGGALGVVILCALLAGILSVRRPPWPWVRSLPWKAKHRIIADSFFLTLHTIPLFIFIAWLDSKAVIPLLTALPLLALYASLVMRKASEYRMGACGRILMYGSLGSLCIGLISWISFLFLALTPLVLKHGIEEERNQKVSLWLEFHHLAVGDPLSWGKQ